MTITAATSSRVDSTVAGLIFFDSIVTDSTLIAVSLFVRPTLSRVILVTRLPATRSDRAAAFACAISLAAP
jgi:hypothetical protein